MRLLVVGGSASNVGKTALAEFLVARESSVARTVAMKVSVREKPCELSVVILADAGDAGHRRDSARLLEAGDIAVVWVTVSRREVRSGLGAGLRRARVARPDVLVIESTSAGIELKRIDESFFVAGEGEWKPWAEKHMHRADRVLTSEQVTTLIDTRRLEAVP